MVEKERTLPAQRWRLRCSSLLSWTATICRIRRPSPTSKLRCRSRYVEGWRGACSDRAPVTHLS